MNASAQQAQQLLREGRIAEAEALYEQVLKGSPDNAEALNFVALAALRRRDISRAVALLQTAVAAHPADFHSRYHLARAYDQSGDLSRAAADYEAALALEPGSHAARLYLAYALDRSGEPERALREYIRALSGAQAAGRWLDPTTTPPGVKPLVERAVVVIRDTKRTIAEEVLSRLRGAYGASELTRVDQAVRIYLREEAAQFPDARQRPTFLYFPGLPPRAYLDRALFPWIEGLEQQTAAILEELQQVLPSSARRERVFLREDVERANLKG